MTRNNIDDRIRAAHTEIFEAILREGQRAVVVDSPPGAGKTTLVENVSAVAVTGSRLRVGIVTANVSQSQDIALRLVKHFPKLPLQLFQSEDHAVPRSVRGVRPLSLVTRKADLRRVPGVVVGTAHKFTATDFSGSDFDVLLCDEAYQLAASDFSPLYHIADQILLVGDPGQLPPLIETEVDRFEASRYKVHWAAPRELRYRIQDVPIVQLPVTRRLPQDTVDFVQPSLYPLLPFSAAASDEERWMAFGPRPRVELFRNARERAAIDQAIDRLAAGATIIAVLLPSRRVPNDLVDQEITSLMANITHRIISRGVSWGMRRVLGPNDIGVIDAHVASGTEIRRHLMQFGYSTRELRVDTPEVWQGLERPIMVVKHPLSGLSRLNQFALEPGRWSVMLSRHQLGCIIVGREGIGTSLEAHTHDCATRPMGAANNEWMGWQAHASLWNALERADRVIRLN